MNERNELAEFYDAELANATGLLFDALNEIKRLRAALREIAEDYVDPREVAIRALGQSAIRRWR